MIHYNGGIAVDLTDIKAIKTEYLKKGGNLVFEFNNLIIPVENKESGELELKSFPNDSVLHYFEHSDSLTAYFEEWVETWQDSKV